MKFNVLTTGFFAGLIFSLNSIDKAVTFPSKSVDSLAQSQDIAMLAKLTPTQVEKLVNLEKNNQVDKVIVPTYIPPGFQVDKLEVGGRYYYIIYRNSNNLCFYFSYSNHLIFNSQDAEVVGIEINLPVIGTAYLHTKKSHRASIPSSIVVQSSDYGREQFGFASPCTFTKNHGKTITTQEVVKIVESLQYLNP
ncbi:hypothetical protein [Okeania sp. SIO1I7]|uniref:hypothetical protein n=1 Tax=Okeania sp. SIO1I7 TaxID=2607772 RepID=UPI0013FA1799|nr:hypothetical protein [Okeania sp. SIO1I7]NET28686.1 hypothetical protein [Okeania sp. SIO1I7]